MKRILIGAGIGWAVSAALSLTIAYTMQPSETANFFIGCALGAICTLAGALVALYTED